jgi:AraC-like DNA-binding protein
MDPAEESDPAEASEPPRQHERRRWPRPTPSPEHLKAPSPPALCPLSFSTRELPAASQLAAWQALMEPLVAISLPAGLGPADGFPADHTAWNLGGMLLVQQSVRAHGYIRSAAKIKLSSIDHWCLVVLRNVRTWTEVDGRVAEGRPGSVELRSLGHAFRGRSTDSESVCLYLPRDRFARLSSAMDARNNAVLSGNFADLLTNYISSVVERLSSLTVEDLSPVVQATSDMIAAALAGGVDGDVASAQLSNLAVLERARRYIQNHLNVSDLTPDDISRALGVSRTRLYKLFEPSGGVLAYVQKRRLMAAHDALGDPTEERLIVDIAEACGFSSAANFSRAFSKEFGYSPRDARSALATTSRAASKPHAARRGSSSFDDWLKMLGT